MDMDVISNLFDSSNSSASQLSKPLYSNVSEAISPDYVTGLLMRSFNEAEEDSDDGIDWGISDSDDQGSDESTDEDDTNDSSDDTSDNDDTNEDSSDESDTEEDSDENDNEESEDSEDEDSEEGEILGSYEAIKDELDSERETLSEIYERFFKDIVDPLFRKLEDSNINVAFDTTKLKTEGLIRIELSHRNSDATAEMEINIFANTVNGEFLGMENSEGEAVSTSLDDVSLDDLLNILIKVLG